MKHVDLKLQRKKKRKMRVRRKIRGTADTPRLSVYKSNRYLYAQVIDDTAGKTLISVSSLAGDTKGLKQNVADAEKFGQALGEKLKENKIATAVFDRNGNLYHGVIKAIAEGARKSGIKF